MKVTGSTIQQLDRTRPNGSPRPRSECRRWRLWATTDEGRKSRRFSGTYTQAQEALKAFVAELEGHVPNADAFGLYAASWLAWRAESGRYSPNSIATYKRHVDALRRSPLDSARMDEVTPDACRDALAWMRANAVSGHMSNTTLAKSHQVLRMVLQQAVDDGKLSRNPMDSVEPPKPDTVERDALAPDEIMALLDSLDALPLDGRVVACYLMLCLGLRRGEACAVKPTDVDGSFIHVRGSVRDADGSIGAPKSAAGIRKLPMPPRLAAKVDVWMQARPIGATLCCRADGSTLTGHALGRWWERVSGTLGCEGFTLHQLRHSNLSMMARHMSPFDLQRWAGWSSIEPARIYIHDDMDSVVRAVLDAWAGI